MGLIRVPAFLLNDGEKHERELILESHQNVNSYTHKKKISLKMETDWNVRILIKVQHIHEWHASRHPHHIHIPDAKGTAI